MKNVILFLLLIPFLSFSQKEANFWYFGKNAGLDFSSGKAIPLTDGKINTDEGCAVISDKLGNLLFYTDGISVWNRTHTLMTNGQNLKGNPSSTSSGVAIPNPKSSNLYYLFTVPATAGLDGLCYSEIDLTLENGLGDVIPTKKNIFLDTLVTEKLTAVKHRNGKDIWVISHKWKNNTFVAYLVTENGVEKKGVLSSVGLIHDGAALNTQGYMKSNPDGSNLALALEDSDIIELFDFDNETGKVSNSLVFEFPNNSYTYGIEFSVDGSKLYTTSAGTGEIFQFNLQEENNDLIKKSMIKVGQTANKEWVGALQVANDGKIYFPIYNTSFLGVIHEPNALGLNCKYENNYINLNGKIATLGLPTFSQSFFNKEAVKQQITYFDDKKIELDKAIILKNITFDFAKHSLKTISFTELDKVVLVLKNNPSYAIQLTGHTDNIGNKSSNIMLSNNRAKSVKEYLVSKGIQENRIEFQGKGSSLPIDSNLTELGRTNNRRVEFVLKKK
ncbi:MAG: OmpA family protein [Bacteroidota bacterium]